jgi:flagellar motor switch protein FliG
MSLFGASQAIIDRITHSLSREEEKRLRQSLAALGPIPPQDAEEARRLIVREAVRMMREGDLRYIK